jgi:putative FmdB family regulatory protein
MPTYTYICRECDTTISEVRGMSAPEPEHMCESCGNKMNKVYSMSNPIFNGSGFYSKDK